MRFSHALDTSSLLLTNNHVPCPVLRHPLVITDESCCTTLADDAVEQAGSFKNAMLLAQSVYTRSPSSSPGNSSSQLPSRFSPEARLLPPNKHGSVEACSSAYQQHTGFINTDLHTSAEQRQHNSSASTTSASSIGSLFSTPQDFTNFAPSSTVPNSDSQLSDDQPVIGKYQRISMQHAALREHVRMQKEQDKQLQSAAPVVPSSQPTPSFGAFKRSSNQSARFSSTSSSVSLTSHARSSPQNLQPQTALLPLSSVLCANGSSSNTCPSSPSGGSSFSLTQPSPLSILSPVGESQEDSCAQQQPVSQKSTCLPSSSSLPLSFATASQAQSTICSSPSLTRKRIPPADIILRTCAVHKTDLRALGIANCEEYTKKVVTPLLQLPPVAALVHRVLDSACGIKSVFAVITYNRPLSTLFPSVEVAQEKQPTDSQVKSSQCCAENENMPQSEVRAAAAVEASFASRNLHFTLRPCVCQDDSAASFSSRFVPGLVVSFCTSPVVISV